MVFGEFFAIVLIEGPAPAGGVAIVFNENVHALPLGLVKSGHKRFFLFCDVLFEELGRGEEGGGGVDAEFDAAFFREGAEALFDDEIVGFREVEGGDFLREFFAVIRGVGDVADGEAEGAEFIRVGLHGGAMRTSFCLWKARGWWVSFPKKIGSSAR